MKRIYSVLIAGITIVGITLSLVGTVLMPQAVSADNGQNLHRQVPKPIPAVDVKVVKKIPLSSVLGEAKGKPSTSPDNDKKNRPSGGAATGVLGEPLPAGANKYAVVIGICDYPGTANDLCWSDGDSLNMYKALVNLYGYSPENIYLLRDTEPKKPTDPEYPEIINDGPATYDNIWNAVSAIKGMVQAGDEVVFFFSGHGGSGIAADGDKEIIDESIVVHNGTSLVYIWDGQLKEWFNGFKTSRIIFVFDSCRAGGMNDVAADGRVINMATGETKVAYVYSTGVVGQVEGEGVFSHYFVNEGMSKGKADKYDNIPFVPDVTIEEAFDYTKGSIPKYLQTPVISDKFINDLLL